MTAAKTPAVVAPSQKTIADTKTMLAEASLTTIAAVAANASATLQRLAGTADAIKGSVTSAVLRVVSKEAIEAVAAPVKDVIGAAGGRVPNLSTVRGAIAKMAAAYGHASTLPHWASVAEAKESGDAAFSALAESCFVDGKLDAQKNVEAVARLTTACMFLGVAENAVGKWREQFGVAIQAIAERFEQEAEHDVAAPDNVTDEDAQILADARAQDAAELETLRTIAEEAKRIFGTADLTALAILMLDAPAIELVDGE
jgi:hypothetical protein